MLVRFSVGAFAQTDLTKASESLRLLGALLGIPSRLGLAIN
jgi:hypothetical protein